MTTSNPLSSPCSHLATPDELQRDALYLFCHAVPGQPCLWARRYDDVIDPPFHSERIEASFRAAHSESTESASNATAYRDAVLGSGLF